MAATIVVGLAVAGPVITPDGAAMFTMGGHGAKLIFFHVPCAWLASLAYIVGAIYAVRVLLSAGRSPDIQSDLDIKACTAMELGLVFAFLATVTGSIFSHNEWLTFWNWREPRMVSIFVILLIFAAYLVLRQAIDNPNRRARLAAAYALIAVVPGLFLIWVLPRMVATLHGDANQAVMGNNLGGMYRPVLRYLALPAFLGLFGWMFQLGVRAKRLAARHAVE